MNDGQEAKIQTKVKNKTVPCDPITLILMKSNDLQIRQHSPKEMRYKVIYSWSEDKESKRIEHRPKLEQFPFQAKVK
jgi:hypothetical protein